MENRSSLDIVAFTSNNEGREIRTKAILDGDLHFNVISAAQARAVRSWKASQCLKIAVDSDGNSYESSKFVSLRWCDAKGAKTWDADFYIVDNCPHDIILAGGSFPRGSMGSGCYPVASPPMSEVMLTLPSAPAEEKRAQEKRRKEVEAEREARKITEAERQRQAREQRRAIGNNVNPGPGATAQRYN